MQQLLARAQEKRLPRIDFTVPAHVPDAAILHALTEGLPLVQGIRPRIVRHRGRDTAVTAFLTYREGVRLADAWRESGALPAFAAEMVQSACAIPDEAARVRFLCEAVARRVRYANTAPGRVGYERLVGAESTLTGGCANCQGFADALYLVCTLSGVEARHIIGRRHHQAHMWNAVRIGGTWLHVDASRVSRQLAAGEEAEAFILRSEGEFWALGFDWAQS